MFVYYYSFLAIDSNNKKAHSLNAKLTVFYVRRKEINKLFI